VNNTQPPAPRAQPQPSDSPADATLAAGETTGETVADIVCADGTPAADVPAIHALDEDERRLLQARLHVRGLVAQLLARPIDPRTNQALRDYLAHDAEPALAALQELASRGPDRLRARIKEILAAPRGALTAGPDTTGPPGDPGGDLGEAAGARREMP
jgi:hypothetical protein